MSTASKAKAFDSTENAKFKFLKSLAVHRHYTEEGLPACSVEVSLTELPGQPGHALKALFVGVTSLKVGDLNGWLSSVIDVADISSWGLEGTRYRITDVETATFSLDCQDFEISMDHVAR